VFPHLAFPLLAALVSYEPGAYRLSGFDVRRSVAMKLLVVQGAGMNMRGKTQTEIFGTMTLEQYNQHIVKYAAELDIEVEIFHSNIEGEVINRLYAANDEGIAGALVNPAGFSRGYPALTAAISQVTFPVIEVHISNPVRRGPVSDTATVSLGMVTGFGVLGYYLALRGLRDRAR
jgi:3-dehydroquinate dehydratase-2